MSSHVSRVVVAALMAVLWAAPASGQSVVVESPTYTSLVMEIDVDGAASDVWASIGGYCDIGDWLRIDCEIVSGDGESVGTVRSVVNEVLVGRTELSYTYTQTPREGRPYNLYHGTLEVRPVTDSTSRIVYSLMWDNSMLEDDAARDADRERRRGTFTQALENMKILAEGGTLPPA